MIKAVIFDIDGVLLDSLEANIAMFQKVMEKSGYPKPSREEVMACTHLPSLQALQKLIGSEDPHIVEPVWHLIKDPAMRAADLLKTPDQLVETLETLHQGYRLAIVTSRIKTGVEELFRVAPIAPLFETVVGFEDYTRRKPDPEPLLIALERMNLQPEEAVYVGDTHVDTAAAEAAGMASIHYGPTPDPKATQSITVFSDLIKTVTTLDK